MAEENYNNIFGDIDLELLDLILKGYFTENQKILDAGCGNGRNLIYFMQKNFQVYAIDRDKSSVDLVKYISKNFNKNSENIIQCDIQDLDFGSDTMDAIICSRVLHFSENENDFLNAWSAMQNILRSGGLLYFSCDSMIGLEDKVSKTDAEKWTFLDGSVRFLLNKELLNKMQIEESFEYVAPMKTIHYEDRHAQTILCLKKK